MARSFLVPINLNQQELQNPRLQNLASPPSSPVSGQAFYDTANNAAYVYNGSAWVAGDASKLSGTIPNGALATNPLARANHTGNQTASTISDLSTVVHAYTLDSFALPAANVALNSKKITGLANPTATGDAATYDFVISQTQSSAAGIASKPPVRAVATANVASLTGAQTVDGVSLIAGDRVLLTAQTTTTANGVYNVSAGAWTRTTIEGAAPGELEGGALWLVTEGTTNTGTQWRQATTGTITVGTTPISVVQFSAAAPYAPGNGLSLTGATFAVVPKSAGGLSVDGTGVYLDTTIACRKYAVSLGDGSTTTFVLTHNLNTQDVVMQVRQAGSPYGTVECDMQATSVNTSTLIFATAPASNAYRFVAHG